MDVVRIAARLRLITASTIALLAIWSCFIFTLKMPGTEHGWALDDFKAFYCSGRAVLTGANPYDAAPLARCESEPAPRPLFVARPGFVLPSPIPGYTIAAMAALAWMPFVPASIVWMLFSVVAAVAGIVLLSRLGLGRIEDMVVVLAIPLMGISFATGELVPIAFFGVALTAWAMKDPRPAVGAALTAAGIALSFLEPQVGAAVAIACVIQSRRSALAALAALGFLALCSLSTIGMGQNLYYVRDVLPAHVQSEFQAYSQFSLSWVLGRLGLPAGPALIIGRLDWFLMLALTAAFAASPFARQNKEIAVLAAPAFAVVGGPFLHLDHTALALPATLWCLTRFRRSRLLYVGAVVALSLPLTHFLLLIGKLPIYAVYGAIIVLAYLISRAYDPDEKHALLLACAAAAAIFVCSVAVAIGGFGFTSAQAASTIPANLQQAAWARFVSDHWVMTAWPIWLIKAPTWFGIAATAASLVVGAWGYGRRKQPSGALNYAT